MPHSMRIIRMTSRYVLGLSLLFSFACQSPANSQEANTEVQDSDQESIGIQNISKRADERDSILDNIANSRSTAITRAVRDVTPAVVSVALTGTETIAYQDQFERFFSQFNGRRARTQYFDKKINNLGSGFIISEDGYIVTNDHVVTVPSNNQGVVDSQTEIVVSFADGTTFDAKLGGTDPVSDIALLKIESEETLDYVPFDSSDSILVGEWVIALGNPYGLFQSSEPTVTVGVVSGYGRDFDPQDGRLYRDMIQTDAAINPGNSGGPLVNAVGEVIGVNSFIYSRAGGSDGVGFAVPAYQVKTIVQELIENGVVDRVRDIGVEAVNVPRRVVRRLQLPDTQGIIITNIFENSAAEKAGLELYDVVRKVGDQNVRGLADYKAFLSQFKSGDQIELTVLRDGEEKLILVSVDASI